VPSESVLRGSPATAPPIETQIAWYANRQHALIRIDQLRALGLSTSAVGKRVARGALFRKYRGVCSAGHASLSRDGEFLAAVFAGGDEALLTGEAGAEILAVRRHRASIIDVLVPRKRRLPPGVRFHEATIHSRDRSAHKRIPVASVPRLCVDLTETLTAIAYHLSGSAGAKSRNEVKFHAMCEAMGIPEPRVNTHVEDIEVDFHWPDRRLIIEIDGEGHERDRTRREDELRDRVLGAHGWTVPAVRQ
jgi:hypothetical protein